MDTATDMSGQLSTQDDQTQGDMSTLAGKAMGGHVPLPADGEYLPLVDAAVVVQRSEKTVRRLITKGKVPNYREPAPPYRILVEMRALRVALSETMGPVLRLEVDSVSRHDVQTVQGQGGHVQVDSPSPAPAPAQPVNSDVMQYLQKELERLHSEINETRTHTRAEVEARERRIERLTDELLVAKRDAGKWEQAEAYRRQLYDDYMRLQGELGEAKTQLRLLEHNPTPNELNGGHEVFATRTVLDDAMRVPEAPAVVAPEPVRMLQPLLWLLLLIVAGAGAFGAYVYWMPPAQ